MWPMAPAADHPCMDLAVDSAPTLVAADGPTQPEPTRPAPTAPAASGGAVGAVVDFQSAAAEVIAFLRDRLGFEQCMVSRKTGPDYVVLASHDTAYGCRPGDVAAWEDTFCARIADGAAPAITPDVGAEPALAAVARRLGMQVGAYVSVQLRGPGGELYGTLCAASPDRREDSLHDELPLLRTMAGLLGALLHQELRGQGEQRRAELAEHDAVRDGLTLLGNRRSWNGLLLREEARCRRYGTDAAVLVVDLDGLRRINDELGHDAGDAVLRRTALALTTCLRETDSVVRLGSDEFAALLVDADEGDARAAVARVRAALHHAGVRASVGAAHRDARRGLQVAWQRADESMRVAKQARTLPALTELLPAPPTERLALTHQHDSPTLPGQVDQDHSEQIEALLRLARTHLRMPVSFVCEIVGDTRTFTSISSDTPVALTTGVPLPLAGSYCQLIVDGTLPGVVPDARLHPVAAALPVTEELGIRAYLGVPVTRRDGSVYGTLCCMGDEPDTTLNDRDLAFLNAVARNVGALVDAEAPTVTELLHQRLYGQVDAVLREGGPSIVLQPIVRPDGSTWGEEALSRFTTGRPDHWFAEAASVGLGPELELCAARSALAARSGADVVLTVNLSPDTVLTPGFGSWLDTVPDLSELVIELTEHAQVADYDSLVEALAPHRSRGLRLAIDDTGAGYASLKHVLRLRPDLIKVDTSLVRGLETDDVRQVIVTSLVALAASYGAQVVAEGIETAAERDVITGLGVQLLQGYLLGRPASAVRGGDDRAVTTGRPPSPER